jgi:hypothetical protein
MADIEVGMQAGGRNKRRQTSGLASGMMGKGQTGRRADRLHLQHKEKRMHFKIRFLKKNVLFGQVGERSFGSFSQSFFFKAYEWPK